MSGHRQRPAIKTHLLASVSSCAVLLFCSSETWAACADDWLGVDEVREGGNIVLHATNFQEFPITFTVRVGTRGRTAAGPKTVTETLQGEESVLVMTLLDSDSQDSGGYRIKCDWTIGDMDARHDDDQVYLFPYAPESRFGILQSYGSRFSHTGLEKYAIDFNMREGTAVHAARAGVVARVVESNSKGCWEQGCGKYANFIVVLHDDDTTGEYYHLQQNGALVDAGQEVAAGQKIGLSGNTGHTTMAHLHFAVYRAASWGTTQSIPVRFLSADGLIDRPRRGRGYQAVSFPDSPEID
jgi:murein DD-endopeptidase MepM/ murein hydrolase activator NlpD